jgi:hypothetical protein
MARSYGGFDIESFEAGRNLWHARIRRADATPVVIDGVLFPVLELGFAWSDPDAAIADAKSHIDHFGRRYAAATLASRAPSRLTGKPSDHIAI